MLRATGVPRMRGTSNFGRSFVKRPFLHASVLCVALLSLCATPALADHGHKGRPDALQRIKHIVVVYEENHSFDNLYGGWEGVEGLTAADAAHTTQVDQNGRPFGCLLQNDVNLAPPALPATCTDGAIASAFPNRPFTIDQFIAPTDTTCPAPGVFAANGVLKGSGEPGGCTRDLVHRFYNEQYQIDGGRQDRYVAGSDAVGLTMGHYDTRQLPIYQYLHSEGAPNYVIADHFFQAAFGGSFLNHQYLVAARAPIDTDPTQLSGAGDLHSVVDANGFPTTYPQYTPTTPGVHDRQLTQACGPTANPAVKCGDYAVNTMQPANAPRGGGAVLPLVDSSTYPTIG